MKFLWTDIETTGLNPRSDLILSVGVVITEGVDRVIARNEWIVPQDPSLVETMLSPYVRDMHTKSGLIRAVYGRWNAWINAGWMMPVDLEIALWLRTYLGDPDPVARNRPAWAGNTVHFDKAFIEAQMPEVAKHYGYRCLDVSSLKLLAMATLPGAVEWNDAHSKDVAHTPLADLDASMRELAHWRRELGSALYLGENR